MTGRFLSKDGIDSSTITKGQPEAAPVALTCFALLCPDLALVEQMSLKDPGNTASEALESAGKFYTLGSYWCQEMAPK